MHIDPDHGPTVFAVGTPRAGRLKDSAPGGQHVAQRGGFQAGGVLQRCAEGGHLFDVDAVGRIGADGSDVRRMLMTGGH
jgi:hypothetical protein